MARDPLDERNFYEHWQGKRTRIADILTPAEVAILEEVVAPLQEEYDGPPLGTRHEYPPKRTPKVHGHAPPDWLLEQRRLERAAWWLRREADHARAMALDQAVRERQRYHTAPEDVQPTFLPKRRRSVRLRVHCAACEHDGHVVIDIARVRERVRLRCTKCDEPQEL